MRYPTCSMRRFRDARRGHTIKMSGTDATFKPIGKPSVELKRKQRLARLLYVRIMPKTVFMVGLILSAKTSSPLRPVRARVDC